MRDVVYPTSTTYLGLAQQEERRSYKSEVSGSIPLSQTSVSLT